MRPPFRILLLLPVLLWSVFLQARNSSSNQHNPEARPTAEILSDTRGIDFSVYVKNALEDVRLRWFPVVPQVARAPRLKQGTVVVDVDILPDGQIKTLKVVKSSGDHRMDRAAFNSIRASSPFAPLPRKFDGQFLALRLHFYYNPAPVLRPVATN